MRLGNGLERSSVGRAIAVHAGIPLAPAVRDSARVLRRGISRSLSLLLLKKRFQHLIGKV
jgi:hypothetical protein